MRKVYIFLTLLTRCSCYNTAGYTYDLANKNLKLVPYFAKPFVNEYKLSSEEREDLLQEGYVGLIMACKKYDSTYGVTIATYSSYWIKRYMTNYSKNVYKHRYNPLGLDKTNSNSVSPNDAVIDLYIMMNVLEPWEYDFVNNRYFKKKTLKQMAHFYDVSPTTISLHSKRIKDKLRRKTKNDSL